MSVWRMEYQFTPFAFVSPKARFAMRWMICVPFFPDSP
jgi:hypothetical protein